MAAPAAHSRTGGSAGGAKRTGQRKGSTWKGAIQRRKDLKASIERSKLERRRAKALKEIGGAQNYTEHVLQIEERVSERRKRYEQGLGVETAALNASGEGEGERGTAGEVRDTVDNSSTSPTEKPHNPRESRERKKRHSALQDALDAAAERKRAYEEREKAYQEGIARRDQKRKERKRYGRERFRFTSRGQPFMSTFVADALRKLDPGDAGARAGDAKK